MSDKWGHLSSADGEANRSVDQVCEVSDAVLEIISCDLHNTSRMLDNGHFWGQEHFDGAIK